MRINPGTPEFVQIKTNGDVVSVQNPFPTDGDSLYAKDIDTANSSMGGFSGVITDLFDSIASNVSDSSATNPKEITIKIKRPLDSSEIQIATDSGDFSNVKILLKDAAGNTVGTIDDSTNNTKYTANEYAISPIGFCTITIQFHTADTVTLSFICIKKYIHSHSQIQALNPAGTTVFVGANTAGHLEVLSHEFPLAVAEGNVSGYANFEKYGRNSDIDTGTAPEDIWNGANDYTGFPTGSAETMEIRSDNSNDTSAGTGARTVKIFNLLDSTGAPMPDITVSLNGTSWVSLGAQTYYRGGTRIKVLTAGSGGENVGEITLRHTTTTANIFAVMPAGRNQTAIAAYTVPLGKTLYIKRINFQMARANGSAGSAAMSFRARPHDGVFNSNPTPEITNSSNYKFENNGYLVYEARTDLKARCDDVSDNNTIITAEFSGFLVDD